MCRYWSKILRFVEQHDPCYYFPEPATANISSQSASKLVILSPRTYASLGSTRE
jgi:hypothetical protein